MFRWYQQSARCYVYMADVTKGQSECGDDHAERWKPAFRKSQWFTRGWTLQELIAPASVEFFSKDKLYLGNKQNLEETIHEITNICVEALRERSLNSFSAEERFYWAKNRYTTRGEDAAYCLLGIFDVQMPLIYGEGRGKALHRLEKELKEQTKHSGHTLSDEQRQAFMNSLRFEQIDTRQSTIKIAHNKTCKWLLKKSEFLDWLLPASVKNHHGFLWIKGKPGAGKSTLMKYAFMHARRKLREKIILSFFFNARGDLLEKSTIGAYRSLLLQLLERIPETSKVFDTLHIATGLGQDSNHQWSNEELKILIEQAIRSLRDSPLICFIDALDECDETEVRDMVSFFERLGELAISNSINLRICFSSRHYPHITIKRGLDLVLEGQEGHTQDITNYLESELKIGKSKVAQEIRTELQKKASGIFMWVVLVVGILNKEHDRGRIHTLRRRLNEIPSDLSALFRDILMRDLQNKDELILCIQWVLFSKHPLRPEQLYFAILAGTEPGAVSQWDRETATQDVIKHFILDASKGLTEITTSTVPSVQFIHESVRDFLLNGDGLRGLWPDLHPNFLGQSHESLKQCCLTFFHDITGSLCVDGKLPKAKLKAAAELRDEAYSKVPFLEYAVQNILYHADKAQQAGISQSVFIADFPLQQWVNLDNLFAKHQTRRHRENVTLLYVLAEIDASHLIALNTFVPNCLEQVEERYGCPLFAAQATGSKATIELFREAIAMMPGVRSRLQKLRLNHESSITAAAPMGRGFEFAKTRNLFSYAAEFGDELIVASLLEIGSSGLHSKDSTGRTPLSYAVFEGKTTVLSLFFDASKIWSQDEYSVALSWGARGGNESTVKMLLNRDDVNINLPDRVGRTAIYYAARNGHEAIVTLFLNTGQCDLNLLDNSGRTSLQVAASFGHARVFRLLLDTGQLDINHRDSMGDTALSHAAKEGREEVVQMLLSKEQCKIDTENNVGSRPLALAAKYGHDKVVALILNKAVVKALLPRSININHKDINGYTALSLAARRGNATAVELLLNRNDIDINSRDLQLKTPLSLATENSHKSVVEILLRSETIDVNPKDIDGKTPLALAVCANSQYMDIGVIKMLLQVDEVEVDSRDKLGRTPLWHSVNLGYLLYVKQLVKKNANVHKRDDMGVSPGTLAMKSRKPGILAVLKTSRCCQIRQRPMPDTTINHSLSN